MKQIQVKVEVPNGEHCNESGVYCNFLSQYTSTTQCKLFQCELNPSIPTECCVECKACKAFIAQCPFCGYKDVQVTADGVLCPNCNAIGPTDDTSNGKVVELWNRRHRVSACLPP